MFASFLLFLAGCLLCAEENGRSGGSSRSRSSTLPSPSSQQSSEHHSLASGPPFPFLITGQQEQQQLQLQLESSGDVAAGDGKTEAAHGGGGGGGNSPPPHVVGGTVGSRITTTPHQRRDGHRKGAGGRVVLGWLRGCKDFLLSIRSRPKVTNAPQRSPPPTPCPSGWEPSKTAHSAVDQHRPRQQQWPPQNGGGDGRGGSGAGGGGALGTFSSDGMRSRGGTPRPGCSSSLVGGGHHQNVK